MVLHSHESRNPLINYYLIKIQGLSVEKFNISKWQNYLPKSYRNRKWKEKFTNKNK